MSKTELIFPAVWEFGSKSRVIGRIDKFSRFSAFVIFCYSAHEQTKTKENRRQKIFLLAGNLGP